MSFPLETYSIATKLAVLLDLKEFTIVGSRKHTGGYPEAKLMALLIVACKLGYNLEESSMWENWAIASEDEEQKDEGNAFVDVREEDILGMSDAKLNEYMDWVQTGWLDADSTHQSNCEVHLPMLIPSGKRRIPQQVLAMFPLDRLHASSGPETQPEASYRPLFPQAKPGRHTQKYTIYRPNIILPPVLRRIIQRAVIVVGVHEDSLRYSIRWLECHLTQWRLNLGQHDES